MSGPPLASPRSPEPAASDMPGLAGLLTLASAVVVVAALDLAREVLIPITLAVLLSFVLSPVANFLRRLRLGRVPSVLLAVLLSLAFILAIGGVIGTQIADLVAVAPRYQSTIEQKLALARTMTIGRLDSIVRGLGHLDTAVTPAAPGQDQKPKDPNAKEPPAPIPVEVHQPDPSPLDTATRFLSPVVGPLSTVAVVFIVAVFILLQREDLRDRMIRLFGSSDLHRTTSALNDAARRLSRYFLAQLAVNAAFGLVIGAGLLSIGVPSPVLWGIMAALLRFLPYLGAPLAAVLPMALAAAVDPGWSMVLWTGALFFVVEMLTGQVIEPMVYSQSTGLSPVSVVVAATFWTWLWGPIGLIMSTPLTLCLVVLGRHVQRLEFLEVLLGDRPALTPVETFYQRILVGDSDEAIEQAEVLLRRRPLCSYYDDVAVWGLRMAADDRLRGVLTERQLDRVHHAFETLVRDLGENYDITKPLKEDAEESVDGADDNALPPPGPPPASVPAGATLPPAWQGDAVLCVAGRGPLDEAAAMMLAQLLSKHGLGATVLAHADVSPAKLVNLDLSARAIICLCYLETSGSPLHVRYLIRRLRQRRRGVPIMVGLWPAGEQVLGDATHQATLGADHYVGSLHAAVNICVEAATQAAAAPVLDIAAEAKPLALAQGAPA